MSDDHQSSPPICTVDPYAYLQIVRNPDGSITRLLQIPSTSASSDQNGSSPVLSKDVPLNSIHNTWLRIYLPRQALDCSTSAKKLPLVVFYHGGGFVVASASSSIFHDLCESMATRLGVIVVNVEYRSAPEHRLPAAYDDAIEGLHWIKNTNDEWLVKHADFSKCFLMGSSAGGNISYYAGLRVASGTVDLEPLKIQGLILLQPFFGGSKRTESELRLINDPVLPLSGSDILWELSLPMGADRDHEYSNPTVASVGNGSEQFGQIKRLGWRILVTVGDGDPLIDRQMELVKMLEKNGVNVVTQFGEGDPHGVDFGEPTGAKVWHGTLENFIEQC